MRIHKPTKGGTRAHLLVVGLLLLVAGGIYIAGEVDRYRIQDRIPELQREQAARVEEEIVAFFEAELDVMRTQARELAQQKRLVSGLRRLRSGNRRGADDVVRFAADIHVGDREAVEIYTPAPALLAWQGPRLPMDDGPSQVHFLDAPVHAVAVDEGRRTALVVWVPVLDGRDVVGAVRLLRLVVHRVPIRNEYLRDYSWAEDFSQRTGLLVDFVFGPSEGEGTSVLLVAPDGRTLGHADVLPRDSEMLVSDRTRVWRNWAVLFVWLASIYMLLIGVMRPTSLAAAFTLIVVTRGLWMLLEIPHRWQGGKAPLAPLFDVQHLATSAGFGLFATAGDLVITTLLLMLFTGMVVRLSLAPAPQRRSRPWVVIGGHTLISLTFGLGLGVLIRRIVLDSTLEYFDRSGLLPDTLVVIVLASLLVLVLALGVLAARGLWLLAGQGGCRALLERRDMSFVMWLILVVGSTAVALTLFAMASVALFMVAVTIWALLEPMRAGYSRTSVALRVLLPALLAGALVLYPMMDDGMKERRTLRMVNAAQGFSEERDARTLFALERILKTALDEARTTWPDRGADGEYLRLLAEKALARSLWSSNVELGIHAPGGKLIGRYSAVGRPFNPQSGATWELDLIQAMYEDAGRPGIMIERVTDPVQPHRFDFVGYAELPENRGSIVVRAASVPVAAQREMAFPRVLSPQGYVSGPLAPLSLAEFRDGQLVRTWGNAFIRSELPSGVDEGLLVESELWVREEVRDQRFMTYYLRVEDRGWRPGARHVIAVREPAIQLFDHLFFLLRLIVAGLFVMIPAYMITVAYRVFRGRRPQMRPFRDRILNAFLIVGLLTAAIMGYVGIRVITAESERALDTWMNGYLERVEDMLLLNAAPGELPYRVLQRMPVDSLAARVGLDVTVYRETTLERTSLPELVQDRLIETRLPSQAHEALFVDGFRSVTVAQRMGRFPYLAGYRVFNNEVGIPRYVVGIPTLPEQERLREESARTLAYLFGTLFLMVLVVVLTASVLARALTRPMAQLQTGLRAVAEGHFQQIRGVDSQDEIGQLVDSFNTMQEQLKESQMLLATQERQLAWREMARQVAHEIKNPLTPMKLTLQHLERALDRSGADGPAFREQFSKAIRTLIEQIDTLARIADEFSSFGRMPVHRQEKLDLNVVVHEAIDLMQAEIGAEIELTLHDGPLAVNGDRQAVRRMFVNFIKNAVQAVPEGRTPEIHITTRHDGTHAIVEVADNGSGIPKADRERIFEPSFSTKTSGTGLGLAIAKRTVETMQGDIGFSSEPGQGTMFFVRLPCAILDSHDTD